MLVVISTCDLFPCWWTSWFRTSRLWHSKTVDLIQNSAVFAPRHWFGGQGFGFLNAFWKICALRCRFEKKLPQGMRLSFWKSLLWGGIFVQKFDSGCDVFFLEIFALRWKFATEIKFSFWQSLLWAGILRNQFRHWLQIPQPEILSELNLLESNPPKAMPVVISTCDHRTLSMQHCSRG